MVEARRIESPGEIAKQLLVVQKRQVAVGDGVFEICSNVPMREYSAHKRAFRDMIKALHVDADYTEAAMQAATILGIFRVPKVNIDAMGLRQGVAAAGQIIDLLQSDANRCELLLKELTVHVLDLQPPFAEITQEQADDAKAKINEMIQGFVAKEDSEEAPADKPAKNAPKE